MSIFVYSPGVRMLVDSTMANATVDVSDDIQSGKVVLTENGLHTMTMNLLNKNRKYDHAFTPNDRFVVYMKRINELVVMTGYLNSVPYVNAWPRSIEITGYCANKRGLYHFWDPGTIASYGLLSSIGQVSGNSTAVDGGMSRIAQKILTQVAGYQEEKIHIGQLPGEWLRSITQVYDAVEAQVGNAFSSLGGANNVGTTNPTVVIGGTPPDIPAGAELPVSWGSVTSVAPPNFDIQSPDGIYWIGMQWGYRLPPNGNNANVDINAAKQFIAKQKVVISNVETNVGVILEPAGWGPTGTSNAISLSPEVMAKLGLNEGDDVNVSYVYVNGGSNVIPGIYNPGTQNISLTNAQANASIDPQRSLNNTTPYVSGGMTGQQIGVITGPPAAAAAFAEKLCANGGYPYIFGGGRPFSANIPPNGGSLDCSALTGNSWFAAGVTIGATSELQWQEVTAQGGQVQQSQIQPGDLIFYVGGGDGGSLTNPGHVTMYVGNNQMAEASEPGQNSAITTADFVGTGRGGFVGIGRPSYAGDTTANGASFSFGPGTSGSSEGATNSLVTYWDWFGNGPDPLSSILYGPRALMNDQPVLPFFDMIIKASMRSWCAAPNGDMICWFPDYFGIYGTAGIINVTAIELEDLSVYWSDQSLVTHQFVAGTSAPSVIGSSPGGPVQFYNIATTMGIATVEFPQILQALFALSPGESTSKLSQSIINRFGIRPNFTPMETIMGPEAEFWYAIYLFQMNWANQFKATVPITFMPELYPGMLMRAVDFGFQGYVTQVTHEFNLSQGGGFKTEVELIAPSTYGKDKGLYSFVNGSYGGMM